MTYTRASSWIKGYENTPFGKHAMQKSGEDDVNIAVDDSKWKVHKRKGRCNKCKKLGHFARECKIPEFIIQKMKGNSKAQRKITGTGVLTSLRYLFVTSVTSQAIRSKTSTT